MPLSDSKKEKKETELGKYRYMTDDDTESIAMMEET